MQPNGLQQGQNHCVADLVTHLDFTELLSTPVRMQCRESNPAMDWDPIQGEEEIIQVTSCEGNQDKLWQDGMVWPDRLYRFLLPRKQKFPLLKVLILTQP